MDYLIKRKVKCFWKKVKFINYIQGCIIFQKWWINHVTHMQLFDRHSLWSSKVCIILYNLSILSLLLIIQVVHVVDSVIKINAVKNYINRIQNNIYLILFYNFNKLLRHIYKLTFINHCFYLINVIFHSIKVLNKIYNINNLNNQNRIKTGFKIHRLYESKLDGTISLERSRK